MFWVSEPILYYGLLCLFSFRNTISYYLLHSRKWLLLYFWLRYCKFATWTRLGVINSKQAHSLGICWQLWNHLVPKLNFYLMLRSTVGLVCLMKFWILGECRVLISIFGVSSCPYFIFSASAKHVVLCSCSPDLWKIILCPPIFQYFWPAILNLQCHFYSAN